MSGLSSSGQICLNPTPVTQAPLAALGRDLDLSPFTRKKRQASDTSSSGVNFQQAKEACEVETVRLVMADITRLFVYNGNINGGHL